MKAILITIKPQHLCNILNGRKLGEVRKNKALINAIKKEIAEKDKATIYCICSKSKEKLFHYTYKTRWTASEDVYHSLKETYSGYEVANSEKELYRKLVDKKDEDYAGVENTIIEFDCIELNGKVACSFECEKVEDIYLQAHCDDKVHIETDNLCEDELLDLVCLTREDFAKYIPNATFGDTLKGNYPCALLHISNLTPFEEPKRIYELIKYNKNVIVIDNCLIGFGNGSLERLTTAPQNFCYIEV